MEGTPENKVRFLLIGCKDTEFKGVHDELNLARYKCHFKIVLLLVSPLSLHMQYTFHCQPA